MQYDLATWAQQARKAAAMTQEDFALALGYSSKASINAIEKGRNNPTFEAMVKMSELSGFPLPYQDEGLPEKVPGDKIRFERLNAEAALGSGFPNDHHIEVVDYVTVARSWARENLGNNLSSIKIITARGDSMKGTIEDGDVMFVDESITYFSGEGIYVIWYADGLKAKRLQTSVDGSLKIISDNERYETETVAGHDLDNIRICGKVKGSWSFSQF